MIKINSYKSIFFYHGSPFRISEFTDEFLGIGHDQLGSGIYATSNRSSARGYAQATPDKLCQFPHLKHAETVHTLRINISKPLDAHDIRPLSLDEVRRIVLQSPELDSALENFGDVEWEGLNTVLNRALPMFAGNDESPLIKVLNTLANDFFRESPAAFNKAAHDVLGYDSVVEYFTDGMNVCVWFAKDIEIIRRYTLKKEMDTELAP